MNKQLDIARKDLQRINYLMIALMLSSLALIILLITGILTVNLANENYIGFVHGYQIGFSFSLFIISCVRLIHNHFLLKNDEKLLDKYINDHDERKLFIADKVGSFSFACEIVILALVSIIAPLYSFDFLIGIIVCMFIISFIKCGLYLFYSRKY